MTYRLMSDDLMNKRLTMSVPEAAKALGIGRGLAYELARTGQIPVLRLGRRLLVPRAQLEALLDAPEPRAQS